VKSKRDGEPWSKEGDSLSPDGICGEVEAEYVDGSEESKSKSKRAQTQLNESDPPQP
jgi:hypothetical protein